MLEYLCVRSIGRVQVPAGVCGTEVQKGMIPPQVDNVSRPGEFEYKNAVHAEGVGKMNKKRAVDDRERERERERERRSDGETE